MTMRERLRQAAWLQQAWQRPEKLFPEASYHWEVFRSRWQAVLTALRKCQLATEHRLSLVLPLLHYDLVSALGDLSSQMAVLSNCYELPEQEEQLTLRHWYEEVLQLENEFDQVTFDNDENKLRVETPVITLEEVCLGAFAIDLCRERQGFSIDSFRIEALNPEPASTDPDVVHPHVNKSTLCVGDGKAPLRSALESGRIADAFLMILSTLQNYNSASAYVKLCDWHGVRCPSCSGTVASDDSYPCDRCHRTLCDQCVSSCSCCSESLCVECLSCCAECHVSCCDSCLEFSEAIGQSLCPSCRTTCNRCGKELSVSAIDEDGFCQACGEAESDSTDEQELQQNPIKEVITP